MTRAKSRRPPRFIIARYTGDDALALWRLAGFRLPAIFRAPVPVAERVRRHRARLALAKGASNDRI